MPRKYTQAQFEEAFWAKVDRSAGPNGCWPWTGGTTRGGYGKLNRSGRTVQAHRIAYELTFGSPSPDKPFVLHRCDNPPCCNAERCLWAGTQADNLRDMTIKGRRITGRSFGDKNGARARPERVPRGERNGRAKLVEADIPRICAAIAAGASYRAIGRKYGVDPKTIRRATTGAAWAHLVIPSRSSPAD